MIKRVVDISEQAYLHITHKQLCVDKNGQTVAKIAIEDLGILILQHPATVITQSVITLCQQNNVAILFCDERHLPISVTLPLWTGHSLHTKIVKEQVASSIPRRKRLWQQVVKAKISEQAVTIEQAGMQSNKLRRLVVKVKSGDPENLEAQAAQDYWKRLMGHEFRRDISADGINSVLNYGYSIVRAMVARSLVGTGLHPAIGLHHKNQYNGLCLADDIMEPFRPWVDAIIQKASLKNAKMQVTREIKQQILEMPNQSVLYDGKKMPFMVSVHYLVAQLKYSLTDKYKPLCYPKRLLD